MAPDAVASRFLRYFVENMHAFPRSLPNRCAYQGSADRRLSETKLHGSIRRQWRLVNSAANGAIVRYRPLEACGPGG